MCGLTSRALAPDVTPRGRWRLLSELARSDRRVGELYELSDERLRCRELHARAEVSLHPGLATSVAQRPRTARARVLFLCTGNSARSQIAEGLARAALARPR